MNTSTRSANTFLLPVVGVLLLAVICFARHPALAQEACPRPAGVTAPPVPVVTAQEVEEGSASLMAFALAVRDLNAEISRSETSLEEVAYLGCLVRQEGSPWRSGATYLVQLTLDGRILVHAADMALSGRQLNPVIYGTILQALGIDPASLTDPVAARAALAAAVTGDGGSFNFPGVPGASGYALVYLSGSFRVPLVLLTGFDLDASHLAEESIDYGAPATTAQDVVDRETLKAFVTEAGNYIVALQEGGDPAASSKARIALRDPDGPWRHGSAYLYVLDRTSNIVLFHATQPDLLELRPLVGTARDGRTGELILPRILTAAGSGPEGGFVAYHYDDPGDDTDSADVPKVGYAREFSGQILRPDGSVIPIDIVVGSGFYLRADGVYVQRILEALEEGQTSMMFGITTPGDGDVVAGDDVDVSAAGAPTDTVHFAYRLAGLPNAAYTYLGAATNRQAVASLDWDTLDLRDDDYELAAFYTQDDGYSVIYDSVQVNVDNVGDGGCAALPVSPGGRVDPTLPALVGLVLAYLMLARRRPAGLLDARI